MKKIIRIENIIFDLYGVYFVNNSKEILLPILQKYGYDKSSVYSRFYRRYHTAKITENDFWRLLGIGDFLKIKKEFLFQHKRNLGFDRVVKNFKKKKIKIFAFSNIPKEWSQFHEKRFAFAKIFKRAVYSWQINCRKPQKQAFIKLIEILKVNPADSLFIDDTIANIRTAKRLGFQTCWFDRKKTNKKPYSADFIIQSFKELNI